MSILTKNSSNTCKFLSAARRHLNHILTSTPPLVQNQEVPSIREGLKSIKDIYSKISNVRNELANEINESQNKKVQDGNAIMARGQNQIMDKKLQYILALDEEAKLKLDEENLRKLAELVQEQDQDSDSINSSLDKVTVKAQSTTSDTSQSTTPGSDSESESDSTPRLSDQESDACSDSIDTTDSDKESNIDDQSQSEESDSESDSIVSLYQDELSLYHSQLLSEISSFLEHTLLPNYQEMVLDIDVSQGCVLEIRPGIGGQEACIFANELFQMYERMSERQGWRFESNTSDSNQNFNLDSSDSDFNQAQIHGLCSLRRMQLESGVHRVQRIPSTEKMGRMQTSSAQVLVLPIARNVDLELNQGKYKDLKHLERECDVFVKRASGPGGQSVNNSCSAVRITHKPTGLWVNMMFHSSQIENRKAGLELLRSKIYHQELQGEKSDRRKLRKSLIPGTGDRSEKIRTYNFQRDSVVDHRYNQTNKTNADSDHVWQIEHPTVGAYDCVFDGHGLDQIMDMGIEDLESRELEKAILEWLVVGSNSDTSNVTNSSDSKGPGNNCNSKSHLNQNQVQNGSRESESNTNLESKETVSVKS